MGPSVLLWMCSAGGACVTHVETVRRQLAARSAALGEDVIRAVILQGAVGTGTRRHLAACQEGFPCFVFAVLPVACGILVPGPGIEPVSPVVEAQSGNHWATREFARVFPEVGARRAQGRNAQEAYQQLRPGRKCVPQGESEGSIVVAEGGRGECEPGGAGSRMQGCREPLRDRSPRGSTAPLGRSVR